MAAVIHSLWETNDRSPLIQPWNVDLDNPPVQNEFTRYLADNWTPVIAKDVDGANSLPVVIDGDAPNLGRLRATQRVARTIYLGSAPIADAARRGIEDTRIKLGCVVPTEALRSRASHVREVPGRRRGRKRRAARGPAAGYALRARCGQPGEALAAKVLASRGSAPRLFRNALVFLAVDRARFQELDAALRRFLAWKSIINDVERLNLDPHQVGQARAQQQAADATVGARIPETYRWLRLPEQQSPDADVSWKSLHLAASGPLAQRAARRLVSEELLVADLGPTVLRLHLDGVPLWRGNHVAVRQLVEDFGQYLYLPRLTSGEVLARAVGDGVGLLTWEQDAFAFADSFDEDGKRYQGLRFMRDIRPTPDSRGVVVRPEAARAQIDAETPTKPDPAPA